MTQRRLRQINFVAAFLNSFIKDRKIYMRQITDFKNRTLNDHVYLLFKALYGLKASPALWEGTLKEYLLEINFIPSPVDPCLWTYKDAIIAIWVDDMLCSANSDDVFEELITLLFQKFRIQD